MPDPHIYPEPPSGPLKLPAAAGMPSPTFTPIEQLAEHDPKTPEIAKTMFIRVATSGNSVPDVNHTTSPNFYLKADTGDAVLINDHAQPPNQTYPIFRKPGDDFTTFIGEASVFLEADNVFRILVAVSDRNGEYLWQLGIWNNDVADSRLFTWVVSATRDDTLLPWIDLTPNALAFDFDLGAEDDEERGLVISNYGTGALVIKEVRPPLAAPFALVGALPLSLSPNPALQPVLLVRFTPPKDGHALPASTHTLVTENDRGPFGPGHNNAFILSARPRQGPPQFRPSPQFDRADGRPGRNVELFGQSFNVGDVSVTFAGVAATIVTTSPNKIVARVPEMPPSTLKITVTTSIGSVTSDDDFRVLPLPTFERFDPSGGHAGDMFNIHGQNLRLGNEQVRVFLQYENFVDGERGGGEARVVATSDVAILAEVPEISSHNDHEDCTVRVSFSDGGQSWVLEIPESFFLAIL